jgi:hypothetical protein
MIASGEAKLAESAEVTEPAGKSLILALAAERDSNLLAPWSAAPWISILAYDDHWPPDRCRVSSLPTKSGRAIFRGSRLLAARGSDLAGVQVTEKPPDVAATARLPNSAGAAHRGHSPPSALLARTSQECQSLDPDSCTETVQVRGRM